MDQDAAIGLLIMLALAGIVIAVLVLIAKSQQKTQTKIDSCSAGPGHNFPVVKRGRTVKCRNCPATFTRR